MQHYIIMSSSYSEGTRIAIDITDKEKLTPEYITKLIKKIKNECGEDVSLSTHTVFSERESWASVEEADKFFANVKVIEEEEEFIREIKKDRKLKGIDVAKYILTKISCTHLKLEKLVYLSFAEYLSRTKRKLFEDKIYAFRYGPVVESVYKGYKKYGGEEIKRNGVIDDVTEIEKEVEESDSSAKEIKRDSKFELPQRSRILFAEDGITKLSCIDEIMKRYGEYSSSELVKITHAKDSPWTKTYKGGRYEEISEGKILKYHCNEKTKRGD